MESTRQRSVKRKLDEVDGDRRRSPQVSGDDVAARVEVENEVSALRETLASQQQTIQDLTLELDEERNAASSAASEAMSMILRLQREKAEIQMEFRQFKRFAEERMAHDQQELIALDDLLFKREQAVQSLSCEIKAHKHRLLNLGIEGDDLGPQTPEHFYLPGFDYDYPPLKCTIPGENYENCENYGEDYESSVLEKYTPTNTIQLQNLEDRIYEMEAEKNAAVGSDSGSVRVSENEFKNEEDHEEEEENHSDEDDEDDDDESARVYTIDAVHAVPNVGGEDRNENFVEDGDIKKLYMRLQALEADRESMRQAIISMRTEKAQLVLLKEIAQQLCKEVAPPEKRRVVTKQPSLIAKFSFAALIKWVLSFIFWRKQVSRSKYSFGLSNNNAGLLLLLDKSPRVNHWQRLMSSRGSHFS